jgi:hypothetical protein
VRIQPVQQVTRCWRFALSFYSGDRQLVSRSRNRPRKSQRPKSAAVSQPSSQAGKYEASRDLRPSSRSSSFSSFCFVTSAITSNTTMPITTMTMMRVQAKQTKGRFDTEVGFVPPTRRTSGTGCARSVRLFCPPNRCPFSHFKSDSSALFVTFTRPSSWRARCIMFTVVYLTGGARARSSHSPEKVRHATDLQRMHFEAEFGERRYEHHAIQFN